MRKGISQPGDNDSNHVFICVYRHIDPSKKRIKDLIEASNRTPLLQEFHDTYFDDNNFYDWGDDPSFFAAKKYLGDEKFATWGVCRTNVRRQLTKGDMIIFICGKQKKKNWDYYYIGYGTVSLNLKKRLDIWQNDKYKIQRNFYNLLIDNDNNQFEPFSGDHDHYLRRAEAGYIFFEGSPILTNFNFVNPLHIAFCDSEQCPIEEWSLEIKFVRDLKNLILGKYNSKGRSLRSSNIQRSHPHIKLNSMSREQLTIFRNELFGISEQIRKSFKEELY